jgi:glycosyltransferase involved in cell wall biosynthesis
MQRKNIFIWQSGEPLHIDSTNHNPMRAINLTNFLLKKGFKVTLISSNFDHTSKTHRKKIKIFKQFHISKFLKIVLIQSPGYKKNISFSRLIDHFILAINLRLYLSRIKILPDLAIVGFPPIEPSIFFSMWLHKKKIPFLFDIKDLWPEYFYERASNKMISIILKLFFYFHDFFLKKALRLAKGIVTNNFYFLKYTLNKIKRKKNTFDKVVFLTKPQFKTNSSTFLNKIKFKRNIFSIYFCGRIDFDVFNFGLVFKSLRLLNENKIAFHFYIAGYGALDKLIKKIENYSLSENVSVLGFVNKFDHATLLKSCNVFIAPFINKKNFSSNFTNKFIEAIQNKLLIITPLKGDVSKFIISNKIGLIYNDNDSNDLVKKITYIKKNFNFMQKELKKNIKKSFVKFDHEQNYTNYFRIISKSFNK